MKNLTLFPIAFGLLLPFFSADAQSNPKKTNGDDTSQQVEYQTDNVANNIDKEANRVGREIDKVGNNIDRIVNRVVNRWTSPFEDEQISEDDTIESKSRTFTKHY